MQMNLKKNSDSLLKSTDTEEKNRCSYFQKVFKYRQEKNPELLPEIDQDLQNLKNLGAFGLARMIDIFLTNYK
jgi:hypothetical protein